MIDGQRLKRKITEKGLSADEFAAACGLNVFTVYRSIKHAHVPKIQTLRAYARVLEIPIGDLLVDEVFEKEAA